MRINRSKLICILAVFLTAIVASAFWVSNDPRYNGRHLSEWFQDLSEDDSRTAEAAIAHFGKTAVPFLLTRIEPSKPPFRESIKEWFETRIKRRTKMSECGLAQSHEQWKGELRISKAFAVLGTNSMVALPRLEKFLEQHETANLAVVALVSIGSASLPVLSKALNNPDSEIRSVVINNLGKIRSGQSEAADLLFKALQDSDPLIRHYAAYAVGELGAQPEKSVQLLIKALEDTDPRVRYITVYALKRFGVPARVSVPALTRLLTDKEENIRKGAEEVVAALTNPDNETSIK